MTTNRAGFLASALRWLRAGYPEGIPATDRVPLLALLRHRLTAQELDHIVRILVEQGDLTVSEAEINAAIEQVTQQEPSAEDSARVAGRLASAGWPLSGPGNNEPEAVAPTGVDPEQAIASPVTDPASTGQRPAFLKAMVGWLRAGYPKGVPPQDYIPLLALLRRRLTDDEVSLVAQELTREGEGSFSQADIGVLITKVTDEMPSEADIDRVRAHIEAAGLLEPPVR